MGNVDQSRVTIKYGLLVRPRRGSEGVEIAARDVCHAPHWEKRNSLCILLVTSQSALPGSGRLSRVSICSIYRRCISVPHAPCTLGRDHHARKRVGRARLLVFLFPFLYAKAWERRTPVSPSHDGDTEGVSRKPLPLAFLRWRGAPCKFQWCLRHKFTDLGSLWASSASSFTLVFAAILAFF